MRTIEQRIRENVADVFSLDTNSVSRAEAPVLASVITERLTNDPVIANATNSEPWYRSRIYLGVLFFAISFVVEKAGYAITQTEFNAAIEIILQLVQAAGVGYAWYGRFIGTRKKALGA